MRWFNFNVSAAICALVVASLAFPVSALAQVYGAGLTSANTQRALSDPPGVDEGLPWGLYGSIGVSVVHDSNVFRTTGNEQSDTAILVPASLTYKQRFGRHQGHLRLSTVVGKYDKFSSEDFEDYTIDGAVLFDLTRRFDVGAFASYTEASEQRGAPGTPIIQLGDKNKVEILSYGADAYYGRQEAKVQLGVGASKDEWRYVNNNQSTRDRDNENFFARAGYRVGPKTDVFVEARHTDISYLQAPTNQDSTEDSIWIGGGWRPTAATSGRVKVGRLKKDFDNPAIEEVETTVYAGTVNWRPRRRHGFQFDIARTTEEGNGLSSYYISEFYGARWDYNFANNWNFYAYGAYIEDDYEIGRLDETTEYGFGVNKSLTSWLSIVAGYSHIERDSNVPGGDYEANLVTLGLNAYISGKLAGPGVEQGRAQ